MKGLLRRGRAQVGLSEFETARADFKRVLELDPQNVDAKKELALMQKKEKKEKTQEKQLYKRMMEKMVEENKVEEAPAEDLGFFGRFVVSLLEPGVTSEHKQVFNVVFILLFIFLTLAIAFGGGNIHLIFLLILAAGVFVSIQWFLGATSALEKEEEKEAKKE